MRKKYILIFILSIFIYDCGYIEIKNKNIIRPKFDNQKIITLKQQIVSFYPVFFIYDQKQIALDIPETEKENLLFKISKKFSIEKNIFKIKDLKNNNSYLIEIFKEENKIYIKERENIIFTITNLYKNDYLNFKFIYNEKIYYLTGEQKGKNDNIIHSINYNITNKDKKIIYIYKELYYMKNNYEIIINKEVEEIKEKDIILLNIFIDLLLKEEGFCYRS